MSPSDLSEPMLAAVLIGGFVTAFLHAALPSHWLPFVLVGRAQGWSVERTVGATALAGVAHIASTAVVGIAIVAAGRAVEGVVAGLLPYLAAVILVVFGAVYLAKGTVMRVRTAGGPTLETPGPRIGDRAALGGLIVVMALSPGEVLLPLYLSQANEGAAVLAWLTVTFALGTVMGMVLFTLMARAGFVLLRLDRWARYESLILGLALIAVGLLVASHSHAEADGHRHGHAHPAEPAQVAAPHDH